MCWDSLSLSLSLAMTLSVDGVANGTSDAQALVTVSLPASLAPASTSLTLPTYTHGGDTLGPALRREMQDDWGQKCRTTGKDKPSFNDSTCFSQPCDNMFERRATN